MYKLILVFLFTITGLMAQSSQAVKVKFLNISFLNNSSKIVLKDGKPVQLKRNYPSDSVTVKLGSDRSFSIYPEGANPSKGESREIGKVVVPRDIKNCLILLSPDDSEYKTRVFTNTEFKEGNICLLNETSSDIELLFDDDMSKIPSASALIISPEVDKAENKKVQLSELKDGKTKLFHKSVWRCTPTGRQFVVLYNQKETGRVLIKSMMAY